MGASDLASGIAAPARRPTTPAVEVKPAAPEVIVTKRNPDNWVKGIPFLKRHFVEHRLHVRFGPPRNYILNLAVSEDVQALNALQAQAHDTEGNGAAIEIIGQERQVVGDKWLCHIVVRDIFYRKLDIHDSDTKPPSDPEPK